jgi:hypothetical protein
MCTALRSAALIAFLLLIFRGAVWLLTLLIVLLLTTAALLLATLASLLRLPIALIGHFWLLELSRITRCCCHAFLFRTHPVPFPPAAARSIEERLLIAKIGARELRGAMDDIDLWTERLIKQLRQVSVRSPLAGKGEFVAMPNTIERIQSSERIEERLLPTYFKRAKKQFDELVRQGDPYSQPLSHASSLLSRYPPPRQ